MHARSEPEQKPVSGVSLDHGLRHFDRVVADPGHPTPPADELSLLAVLEHPEPDDPTERR